MALLEIKNLIIEYRTDDGVVKALNDVSLTLDTGRTLGLVGETGAGKTTLAKGIERLIPNPPGHIISGEVLLEERDLLQISEAEMRKIRGSDISMIFQDPMTALNPVMTVGDQILEVIETHENKGTEENQKRMFEILELVGIPASRHNEYPHQFSGGMKQRVVIAIALACNPRILIADEPTTALDVTIQAQVLSMIRTLREKYNTAMLLITHDLGVVAQNCDDVAVIYAGEIVEQGTVHDIFKNMLHPYTIGLFNSIPSLQEDVDRLKPIPGLMPDPTDLPSGCFFSPRCPYATEACHVSHPPIEEAANGHQVRCFNWKEVLEAKS